MKYLNSQNKEKAAKLAEKHLQNARKNAQNNKADRNIGLLWVIKGIIKDDSIPFHAIGTTKRELDEMARETYLFLARRHLTESRAGSIGIGASKVTTIKSISDKHLIPLDEIGTTIRELNLLNLIHNTNLTAM